MNKKMADVDIDSFGERESSLKNQLMKIFL